LVVKNGQIAYYKSFGTTTYGMGAQPTTINTLFDMASVTKICATTIAIMHLYEQGKVKLTDTIGKFLPWLAGSNKTKLTVEEILLHQAGLVAFIPFYKNMIDKQGKMYDSLVTTTPTDSSNLAVAANLYLKNNLIDSIFTIIKNSPLGAKKYVYSDNDFIFLGKIVETISGLPLDAYVAKYFYEPMQLPRTLFNPLNKYAPYTIAPTEREPFFRNQLIHGTVHDPGAALFGGVAGHAGLFSDALGIASIMHMLINNGVYNNMQYLQPSTINKFTAYNSSISRRGLGFDKPEKNNFELKEPYPNTYLPLTGFGHTGFTGTCTWADPINKIVYVFLSNRVHPNGGDNKKLGTLNIRGKIHDIIYKAIL
jgi:beta-N-acetylhexosaminidase